MFKKLFILALISTPLLLRAQSATDLIFETEDLIGILLGVMTGIVFLTFLWGVARYILQSGNEEKRKELKRFLVWSILALFVMASLWGIIKFFQIVFFSGPAQNYIGPYTPT